MHNFWISHLYIDIQCEMSSGPVQLTHLHQKLSTTPPITLEWWQYFCPFFFTCCSWNAIKIAWISVVCILSFHIVMWINYFTYFGTNHYTSQAVLNTDTNYYEWSVPHQGHTVNTFMNYEYTLYGIRNNVIWNKNKLFQMTSIWQYSHIVNIADSTHIL